MKKGSRHTKEAKLKISLSHKGKGVGEENNKWKGDNVGYVSLHEWIVRYYGKAKKCENPNCKFKNPKRFEWANISGNYKRERSDYIQLCPSCHRKMDKKHKFTCIYGHKLEGENLWINNRGNRVCLKCKSIHAKEHYQRNKDKIKERVKLYRKNKKSSIRRQ